MAVDQEQEVQVEQDKAATEFAQQATEEQPGLIAEFLDFLVHNKKWWLTPIILVLLLAGALAFFGGSGSVVAPFIYPIF
ncbi:MAG: DUF5989 family protein [Planctomycetota bacterium]|nr:DUF5989 family protein [Planctomycetota bacterium]